MAETFVWKDLTFKIGEMSRKAALACSRHYRELTVEGDLEDLMYEIEVALALHAPVRITLLEVPLADGTHALQMEDGTELTFTLPITKEGFDALPMTLAQGWAGAAMGANMWLMEALKNSARRMAEMKLELLSGSEPLSEPTPLSPTTETIG